MTTRRRTFTCPVCHNRVTVTVYDLPADGPDVITAECENKHRKVRMASSRSELRRLTEQVK